MTAKRKRSVNTRTTNSHKVNFCARCWRLKSETIKEICSARLMMRTGVSETELDLIRLSSWASSHLKAEEEARQNQIIVKIMI